MDSLASVVSDSQPYVLVPVPVSGYLDRYAVIMIPNNSAQFSKIANPKCSDLDFVCLPTTPSTKGRTKEPVIIKKSARYEFGQI